MAQPSHTIYKHALEFGQSISAQRIFQQLSVTKAVASQSFQQVHKLWRSRVKSVLENEHYTEVLRIITVVGIMLQTNSIANFYGLILGQIVGKPVILGAGTNP